jgi:uncharacterized membrane protein YbhN (UPF0104 family)
MSWRRRLFLIGLSIGLVLFLRQAWVGFREIQQHDLGLTRPGYLLAALGASIVMYTLQMLAWALIMRALGVSLGMRQTFSGYTLSFLPRYIPGTVWGYWTRSEWLERSYGVEYAVSGMGSVLEAFGAVLTGLFMAGIAFSTQLKDSAQLLMIVVCVGLLGVSWVATPWLTTRIGRRFWARSLAQQHGVALRFGPWSVSIVLYLGLWMAFGAILLLVANSLMAVPIAQLPACVLAASASWVVGFLAVIVPTGLGVRELALSSLLSSYAGFVSWQADVVAVVSRFAIVLAELAWLIVGLVLFGRERWKRRARVPPASFSSKE